jgi:hypothetical protein
MDKRIYKYELEHVRTQRFLMPLGARIIEVAAQPGAGLCMWAVIDRDQPPQLRQFTMYQTGERLPDNPGEHLCTVQGIAMSEDGPKVVVSHIFEVEPTKEEQ